jgi:F0F1-type ATP synthase assembly protein I
MTADKPRDDRALSLQRALKAFQDNVARSGDAAGASYGLIGAILLFGGVGYALDSWRGTAPSFLLAGLITGIVVGFYGLAKTLWRPR